MLCHVVFIHQSSDLFSQLAALADFEIEGVTEFIRGMRIDARLTQRNVSGGLIVSYACDAAGFVWRAADVALERGGP